MLKFHEEALERAWAPMVYGLTIGRRLVHARLSVLMSVQHCISRLEKPEIIYTIFLRTIFHAAVKPDPLILPKLHYLTAILTNLKEMQVCFRARVPTFRNAYRPLVEVLMLKIPQSTFSGLPACDQKEAL